MQAGTIYEAARRDSRQFLLATAALLGIAVLVLGINWKYVYNWVAGPVPFTAALAAAPGAREFVRAEGELAPTGFVQESTFRLLKGLAESKRVSANYLAMIVEGKALIVKVDPEFSGKVVEGRLVPLPETIRASLGPQAAAYPWLLDAHIGYRWDFNLFVMIAGPLFPLLLLLFGYAAWRATSVEKHPEIAALGKQGPPAQVAARIENEMRREGAKARVGPFWIGGPWIVTLAPEMYLIAASDLIAVGHAVTPQKSGPPSHAVRIWRRGRPFAIDVAVSEPEARAVLERLDARHPGRRVEDVAVFGKRWDSDQKGCELAVPAGATPAPAARPRPPA